MTRRTPPLSARELRQQTLPRRALDRTETAIYLGVSPRTLSKLVAAGRAPQPRVISTTAGSTIEVWDVAELDGFIDKLPHRGDAASAPGLPPRRRPFSL